jgi:hypothetical protein
VPSTGHYKLPRSGHSRVDFSTRVDSHVTSSAQAASQECAHQRSQAMSLPKSTLDTQATISKRNRTQYLLCSTPLSPPLCYYARLAFPSFPLLLFWHATELRLLPTPTTSPATTQEPGQPVCLPFELHHSAPTLGVPLNLDDIAVELAFLFPPEQRRQKASCSKGYKE